MRNYPKYELTESPDGMMQSLQIKKWFYLSRSEQSLLAIWIVAMAIILIKII